MPYLKYISVTQESLPDIPARDLSRDEFDGLSEDQRAAVLACGAYEVVKSTKQKDAPVTDGSKE